jgi:hypothetical protein
LEAVLQEEVQGVRAMNTTGETISDRCVTGDLLQVVYSFLYDLLLFIQVDFTGIFVLVAVVAYFVPVFVYLLDELRVFLGRVSRDKEGGLHLLALEDFEDPGKPRPGPIFTAGQYGGIVSLVSPHPEGFGIKIKG